MGKSKKKTQEKTENILSVINGRLAEVYNTYNHDAPSATLNFASPNKGKNDEELNFCTMYTANKKGKISVTAQYKPVLGKEYIRLNPENLNETVSSTDYSDYYYGASPRIDGNLMIRYISKLELKNEDEILKFLKEHANDFALHAGYEKYMLSIAKYLLLSVCSNFGIILEFETPEEAADFVNQFPGYENVLLQKGNEISVCGCPTEDLLKGLEKFRYIKVYDDDVCKYRPVKVWYDESCSIEEVYKNIKSIRTVKGNVFYSGVMLRPLHIYEDTPVNCNKGVIPLVIVFERSTYGTVYSFDNNFINHPLLNKDDKILVANFFTEDDAVKRKLVQGLKNLPSDDRYNDSLLSKINEYLKKSSNVNQICVAGSLLSRDQYLFFCQRSTNSIDSGKLYPSVNGNAEVKDPNVEFYKKSADEDAPLIDLNDVQIGFGGELSREARAELGLQLPKDEWKCYGIAMLGMVHENAAVPCPGFYPYRKRRMHFTIVMHQNCGEEFSKIRMKQKYSTEYYESRKLYGIKFIIHKRMRTFLYMHGKEIARKFVRMKNFILSCFTILLFFLINEGRSGNTGSAAFWASQWQRYVAFLLAIAVVVVVLIEIATHIKRVCVDREFFTKEKHYTKKSFVQTDSFRSGSIKNKFVRKEIRKGESYRMSVREIQKTHSKTIKKDELKKRKSKMKIYKTIRMFRGSSDKLAGRLEKYFKDQNVYPITLLLYYCYIYNL